MIARLRSNWFAIRASYWFYPALFALTGLGLAAFLVHLDRIGAADWLAHVSWLNPARPDGASSMLQVLASAMIGVASTVFSITIAAVAYASGTYGPRILTNFMEDRGNQISLATFIGTFVYAIGVLRAVRAEDEQPPSLLDVQSTAEHMSGFVPQLSLLVAFVLMVVAVGVLVYFLHHIPASIRINTVLENIGKRLLNDIEHRFPQLGTQEPTVKIIHGGSTVMAGTTGYIRLIEMAALADLARKYDLQGQLLLRPGDFAYPGVPLLRVDRTVLEDETAHEMRSCFALGGSRTHEQDLEFSIDELVEIALRALSPGVNDPFTAITAIHWLGAATAAFAGRDLSVEGWQDADNPCPISMPSADFAHFLERGFVAIRSAVATSRLAALVALDSLESVAAQITAPQRRDRTVAEITELAQLAQTCLPAPDADAVRTRHAQIIAYLKV